MYYVLFMDQWVWYTYTIDVDLPLKIIHMQFTCKYDEPGMYTSKRTYTQIDRITMNQFSGSILDTTTFPSLKYFMIMSTPFSVRPPCDYITIATGRIVQVVKDAHDKWVSCPVSTVLYLCIYLNLCIIAWKHWFLNFLTFVRALGKYL